MNCEECDAPSIEVVGSTEDDRTELRCRSCGFQWIHGPSPEDKRAGRAGGRKYHCPVCSEIFSDPTTPIVTIGTPSHLGHRCDKTKSFALGTTYGLNVDAMDKRLAELTDEQLADWPRVIELKHERLS